MSDGAGICEGTRIHDIYKTLLTMYPGTTSTLLESSRGQTLDVLIATILSQATNDNLSSRAFDALRRAFSTWEEVLAAKSDDVEKALAVGGLQKEKTKKIQATLAKLKADFGKITLEPLDEWPAETCFSYLTSLPGVGPKTAACVIGFGLCRPAFPVDTHVLRISKRLGLVPRKAGAAKAQQILSETVAPEIQMPLHVMMIRHGRTMCHARNPKCEGCPMREVCRP